MKFFGAIVAFSAGIATAGATEDLSIRAIMEQMKALRADQANHLAQQANHKSEVHDLLADHKAEVRDLLADHKAEVDGLQAKIAALEAKNPTIVPDAKMHVRRVLQDTDVEPQMGADLFYSLLHKIDHIGGMMKASSQCVGYTSANGGTCTFGEGVNFVNIDADKDIEIKGTENIEIKAGDDMTITAANEGANDGEMFVGIDDPSYAAVKAGMTITPSLAQFSIEEGNILIQAQKGAITEEASLILTSAPEGWFFDRGTVDNPGPLNTPPFDGSGKDPTCQNKYACDI